MSADFVLFQTEFCWKFSNNNLNHRHKHQFPDDYRERLWRLCLLEQKRSKPEHIYTVTSAGLGNSPPKSEATLPVVATRLVYLAAIQTTYTWLQSLCCGKPGFHQYMRENWLQRDKHTDLRFPSAVAVITLTTSHWVCAGMQESQCTRDSVDWGKVLGTL